MSKSFQKRQAIAEAIAAYKSVKATYPDYWAYRMNFLLKSQGWSTNHPGQDKWVAIKGSVVAKWVGRSGYSDNAIEDEIRIFRALKRFGLHKHVPRVYAVRNRELIVEQLCPGKNVDVDDVDEFNNMLKNNFDHEIVDFHFNNARRLNGILKVIDGRICEWY